MYESDPSYKGIKSIAEIPVPEKELLKDVHKLDYDLLGNPTTPEEAALWQALDSQTTYHQWINRRLLTENSTKATVRQWESKFRELAEYKGTDYLADLTKADSITALGSNQKHLGFQVDMEELFYFLNSYNSMESGGTFYLRRLKKIILDQIEKDCEEMGMTIKI